MIDEQALDRAVRRFHSLIQGARAELATGGTTFWGDLADHQDRITAEYRRIVAKE